MISSRSFRSKSATVRPTSILLFEKLFLASTAIVLLNTLVNYSRMRDLWLADGLPAAGPLLLSLFLGIIPNLLFWFFIARRASNVAKWILATLLALGVASYPWTYADDLEVGTAYLLVNAADLLLMAAATLLLFRRDSAEWLKNRGRVLQPEIFE
jgi:hypothetical protein